MMSTLSRFHWSCRQAGFAAGGLVAHV